MKTVRPLVRAAQHFAVESKASDGDRSLVAPAASTAEDIPSREVSTQVDGSRRSDEQLLLAYRAGDRQSFTELMTRYERELYHFLVRFLGDRAAAEDMFQETFLQVHQSAHDFDTTRRFRPWLFTIAANKARDLLRANSRRPANPLQASIKPGGDEKGEFLDLLSSSVELPDQPIQLKELQERVQHIVTEMPDHLKEILMLSYFNQFPYRQISGILNIPLGTVKSRLHAAVAYFAGKWKESNLGRAMS